MKTILLSLSILLCVIALPVFAELTEADLNKIRLIVKDEVSRELSKELTPIKADMVSIKTDIEMLKTEGAMLKTELSNLKENVKTGFENVQKDFDDIEKDFDNIQKHFDRQNNIIIACIGLPMAILAIGATLWGISAHRRNQKDQTLEKQIQTLTEEIETLKQQRIVNP